MVLKTAESTGHSILYMQNIGKENAKVNIGKLINEAKSCRAPESKIDKLTLLGRTST
jgi:hypothetical protein